MKTSHPERSKKLSTNIPQWPKSRSSAFRTKPTGEDVVAVVSLKPGQEADEQDIRTQAAQSVTKFKVPGKVFFVDDLPKSGIGKILKRELRDRFKGS